jgi:dTDP-4-dehydrorhamnose reductase
MKVLVIGASGMIGSTMMRVLAENKGWLIYGTVRCEKIKQFFEQDIAKKILTNIDVSNHDSLISVFDRVRPDVVINCAGLTKHILGSDIPVNAIPINSLMSHQLAELCKLVDTRLIHISTDCVYSGMKGSYLETDPADSIDIYGKSKLLGEVDYPHALTIRTSTIGHELSSKHGLLEWFLSQEGECVGFQRAIFSGLPTIVLAQIIRDIVIPNKKLHGLYHVSAQPISKYELLKIIAEVYGKSIKIIKDEKFTIDRSLNSDKFRSVTGYAPPNWPELIKLMHSYQYN